MKTITLRSLALGALVCALAQPAARAEGWFKEMDHHKLVALGDVLKAPHDYRDVPVKLHLYFQSAGRNFNPYYTRFVQELYGNFAAWPINARLYEKRDWLRPYPLFFVKRGLNLWPDVREIERMTAIEVVAVVRDVFRGQPWLEVTGYRTLGDGLTEEDVRDIAKGDALFHAGKYRDAARAYSSALSSDHSDEVRADVYRRLGDAKYHAGRFSDARSEYRTGLRYAPESAVLKQGVAASNQQMEIARARSRKKPVPVVTLEPAPFHEPATSRTNDVDLLIAMFEDPTQVVAEERAELDELLNRSQAVRASAAPEAAPVIEDSEETVEPAVVPEPTPEPTPQPAEPDAMEKGSGEEVVVPDDVMPEDLAGAGEEQPQGPAMPEEMPAEEPAAQPEPPAAEPVAEAPAPDPGGSSGEEGNGVEAGMEEGKVEESGSVPPEGGFAVKVEESASGPESTPEETFGPVEMPASESTVQDPAGFDPGDPRVVTVGGQRMRLPRMPFYGCEEVSVEDLVAIFEEILNNPEF